MSYSNNMDNFGKGWRLVCHNCKKVYPEDTAISIRNADCCKNPDIHVHGKPCSFCSIEGKSVSHG